MSVVLRSPDRSKAIPRDDVAAARVLIGLRQRHRVEAHQLPYNKTYGLPIQNARRVRRVSYKHPSGAIGLVSFV